MNFQNIYIYLLLAFMDFIGSYAWHDEDIDYQKLYGDGYGTEWIFFPDGDGMPHIVNLTILENDNIDNRMMYEEITFRLYTSNNTEKFIMLNENGKPVDGSNTNTTSFVVLSDKPLKVITHGWKSSVDMDGVQSIKNAYLETQKANVITVDWSTTANSIFYHWVASETKAIGARIAAFLEKLVDLYKITGDKIHLIGHSLGAHVMGIAASETYIAVNRVTGLDPARPFFEFPPQENVARLDPTDAQFVDVIHTCGGLLGCAAPIGTVDFYPNNGIAPQPGCEDILKYFEACSHGRSFYYFSESIRHPKSFPAYQCQTWSEFLENKCSHSGFMGEGAHRNMSGKFYLKTNAVSPFGLPIQHFLKVEYE